jgi:hypothetical protein
VISHIRTDDMELIRQPFSNHAPVATGPEKSMRDQYFRQRRVAVSEDIQHRF